MTWFVLVLAKGLARCERPLRQDCIDLRTEALHHSGKVHIRVVRFLRCSSRPPLVRITPCPLLSSQPPSQHRDPQFLRLRP
ncbi:hypothetical protein T484DRAFT_1958962 [Baffinella frigidus]|nr:hypothetical protein T484DRAFT_1958962 [Cryptophyta sp. CCMP2293]